METSYAERGYHVSISASKDNLHSIVQFFDDEKFYFEDMLCVDYKDYLEVVYFFNNYGFLCRVKVAIKVDPDESARAHHVRHIRGRSLVREGDP